MEVLFHGLDGEVVVESSVEEGDAVHPDGLKDEGEAHGGADGLREVSLFEDNGFFIVDVGGNAAEGDKEVVEVLPGLRIGLCDKGHKGLVDLNGIDEALGEEVGCDLERVGEVDGEVSDFRGRIGAAEVVAVFRFNNAGLPVFKFIGEYEAEHFVGRVSHGVEASDDGTDGRPRDVVDGDTVFFKGFDYADVCGTFGTSAAEDKPYGLRGGSGIYKKGKRESDKLFHSFFCCANIGDIFTGQPPPKNYPPFEK
ncbi:hypothetical protein Barb7_02975 [Bacteroidales bacterium Barb7]|nr:hypothetical protein Barb7_02975 [Bacteroidales bacterium Barb7]